jgi:hypothetical protein
VLSHSVAPPSEGMCRRTISQVYAWATDPASHGGAASASVRS